MNNQVLRSGGATLVVLGIGLWAWALSADQANRALVFSLLTGLLLGVVLQRSRFCFLCNFRDFMNARDSRGLIGILVALLVGTLLYTAIIMAWVPVPQPDRLPPNAHIGPVGPVLVIGSLVFGLGMAISGSCLSAHFYRLGEGSPTSPFALIGAAAGFLLGFITWNPLYAWSVADSPSIWLPHYLGYAGSLLLALVVLTALILLLFATGRWTSSERLPQGIAPLARAIFRERWPAAWGGVAVGTISAIYFFRVAPLGVTAELGSIVRTEASRFDLIPETLRGLDTLRGCATVVKQAILSNNGLLVIGIIAGSFAAALIAGQFKPTLPTGGQVVRGLTGGLLLGWGAMTSLGCTIGVLLSGINAGALSGWVFLIFCTLGVWLGLKTMQRLGW